VAARDAFGNRLAGGGGSLRALARSEGARDANASVAPLGDSAFQVKVDEP